MITLKDVRDNLRQLLVDADQKQLTPAELRAPLNQAILDLQEIEAAPLKVATIQQDNETPSSAGGCLSALPSAETRKSKMLALCQEADGLLQGNISKKMKLDRETYHKVVRIVGYELPTLIKGLPNG